MSIDTSTHDVASAGHHDTPEVVDKRERLGVWLFIGADAIILAALLFTYLYLRGVDTGGHWTSMLGYKGSLHTYEWYDNAADAGTLAAPSIISVPLVSAGLQWLIVVFTVVSAGALWLGEKGLRATKNAGSFTSLAVVSAIAALVGAIFAAVLIHDIPQIFVAANDSLTMSYTAYDSAMMVILGSILFHLVVLAFIGFGLAIRATRGVVSGEKWYQARLARLFFVWVALGSILSTLITTTVTTVH